MKNKKILLFIFTILAFLGLGIGYAALTDTLTLTGTVNGSGVDATDNDVSDAEAFQLNWAGYNIINQKHNGTVTGLADIETTITFNSENTEATIVVNNMSLAGDYVELTFNIKNNSEYHVYNYNPSKQEIYLSTDPTTVVSGNLLGSNLFEFVWNNDTDLDLCAGETKTIFLRIKLNETITDATAKSYIFKIGVTGNASPKCIHCPE